MNNKSKNIQNAESLSHTLKTTALNLSRKLNRHLKKNGFNISHEQTILLQKLWEEDGQHQKALSICTDKDKYCITRLLDNMEKNDLVVRIPDENDRRTKRIYLTHKGKSLQVPITQIMEKMEQHLLQGLDGSEISQFKKYLFHLQEKIC
jgi:DNA-binding MarR family transcriptional regulator